MGQVVIELTKFDGTPIWINPDLIQSIEANPDTRITLTTDLMLMVREEPLTITQRIAHWRRSLLREARTPEAALHLIRTPEDR